MTKEDLTPGAIYQVQCPKFNIAIWTDEDFKGPVYKDGALQFDYAGHYEDGLPSGIATPIEQLSDLGLILAPYDGHNLLVALRAFDTYLSDSKNRRNV